MRWRTVCWDHIWGQVWVMQLCYGWEKTVLTVIKKTNVDLNTGIMHDSDLLYNHLPHFHLPTERTSHFLPNTGFEGKSWGAEFLVILNRCRNKFTQFPKQIRSEYSADCRANTVFLDLIWAVKRFRKGLMCNCGPKYLTRSFLHCPKQKLLVIYFSCSEKHEYITSLPKGVTKMFCSCVNTDSPITWNKIYHVFHPVWTWTSRRKAEVRLHFSLLGFFLCVCWIIGWCSSHLNRLYMDVF